MPKPNSQRDRLRQAGIRHYDELIHDQPKEWLHRNFSQGATDYPINVVRLMRNIVWQTRERIIKGEREPLKELLRTFWYMHIKPTLSRAGALSKKTDQYVAVPTPKPYLKRRTSKPRFLYTQNNPHRLKF